MLYSEFKNALVCNEKGYIVKLSYERFMQINFSELNVSAILLSDSKDFDLTNTNGSLIITDRSQDGSVIQNTEILVHEMKPGEYDVIEFAGKKYMVIVKPLREQVTVDGLIFVNNKDTALALLNNFADPSPVTLSIPFPEDTMMDFLDFMKSYSNLVSNIEIIEMEFFDNNGNPRVARGLNVNVVYDIIEVLEREKTYELRTLSNQKYEDKIYKDIEKIRSIRGDQDLISEDELDDILEEYASTTKDNEHYYGNEDNGYSLFRQRHGYRITKEEYDIAYENLCKELANHAGDGKVDFIFNGGYNYKWR